MIWHIAQAIYGQQADSMRLCLWYAKGYVNSPGTWPLR